MEVSTKEALNNGSTLDMSSWKNYLSGNSSQEIFFFESSTQGIFGVGNSSLGNSSHGNDSSLNGTEDYYDYRDGFVYTMRDTQRQVLGLITGFLGMPTILWLLAITLTANYRKLSYSLYLSAMSVYDFLFVFLVFTDSAIKYWRDWQIRDYLTWEAPCRLYDFIVYSGTVISIWLNVALALDRFIVIAFPFKKDRFCTRKMSWLVCGGISLAVHLLGITYLVYSGVKYIYIIDRDFCNGETILIDMDAYLELIGGVMPAVILVIVLNIVSVVQLSRLARRRKKMTSGQSGNVNRTSRATISLVTIGICTMIGQLPNFINEMLLMYARNNDEELFNDLKSGAYPAYADAVEVFHSLKLLTNIQNFFILFIMNDDFRRDAGDVITCGLTSLRRKVAKEKKMLSSQTSTRRPKNKENTETTQTT